MDSPLNSTNATNSTLYQGYANGNVWWSWPDSSVAIVWLLLIPFALVGNIFVIWTVFKVPRMKSPTNILFVNMAVCDILTALTLIPYTFAQYYLSSQMWFSGTFGVASCKTVSYVGQITISGSVVALTLMAIDRYFAICRPMLRVTFFRRYKIVAALVWVPSMILMLPVLVFADAKFDTGEEITKCFTNYNAFWAKFFHIYLLTFLYLVPLFILALLYGIIAKKLWSTKTRDLVAREDEKVQKRQRKHRKIVAMLIIVLVVFAICWLPMYIVIFLKATERVLYLKVEFIHFAFWLCQANSAINPFLYIILHSGFRRAFKGCLHKCGLPVKSPTRDEELQTLRPQEIRCTSITTANKI